ncbi:MAG TPA: 5-(carboxyamino)imidazole ribonucleotide synthase [Woeseiaceae bacterium]|nr:5-(carboxyamino)imidazole ribonucleotide synthase [Woeseiaceae bacterium]
MTTVGVIGGGQLGRMLGFAGRPLDLDFVFLEPAADPPAAAAGAVIRAAFDSEEALAALARRADVVTYEFENVPAAALEFLSGKVPVHPPGPALTSAQDRLREKELFADLEIPVPAYRAVDSEASLTAASEAIGLPLVLKTRRFGYDGKGQALLRTPADVAPAWQRLGDQPLIAEAFVGFERELSVIGARRADGETAVYPLVENRHRDGILRVSKAPVEDRQAEESARRYLLALLERLDYVGVLALELFQAGGALLANEFAPRVHNSGHWTIEGAATSQFENHLRAVLGLPLGETRALGHAGMVNLIGTLPARPRELERAGFRLHDYGKMARPGRKLGHATTVAESAADRDGRLSEALKIIEY